MFIITGNDPEFEKVKILDTSDGREEWVFYKTFRQGIKNGLAVAGLDNRGNIICQSLDVYKEIIKKSIPIRAKIALLKLDKANQMKLFLNLLEPYGLAQTEEDIQYSIVDEMLALLFVGKCLDLQTGFIKRVSIGVYASADIVNPLMQRQLVTELNQMIFDSDETEIHYISYIPKRDSYACIIGPRLYEVHLYNYPLYSSLEHTLQRYCHHMVHRVYYEMYIEDAWYRRTNVLIDKMELLAEAASFNQEVCKKMLDIIKRI